MDSGFIPEDGADDYHAYRPRLGDRVAVFGRWIVDCGHTDFHTEIHPPLVLARAESVSADETLSTVVARPYLVSQEFGVSNNALAKNDIDGALRKHLLIEIGKIQSLVSTQVEAHPKIFPTPFSGEQLIKYVVRPVSPRVNPQDKLSVSFHFTTRSGIVVQVVQEPDDAVGVIIALNDVDYKPAPLPSVQHPSLSVQRIAQLNPDAGDLYGALVGVDSILNPAAAAFFTRGIQTDTYNAPVASSPHDTDVTTVDIDALPGGPHFSVDDDQPFPVYGWLDVKWKGRGVVPHGASITGVAGYFATVDGYQHVIATTNDGTLTEVYFKGNGAPVRHDVLGQFNGIVGVAGYYAPSDGYQHVIVATNDGTVHEVYFKGNGQGVGQDMLATFNGIVGVTGYYAESDGYQHVIVATSDGAVHEVYFKGGGQGVGQDVLATFNGIVGVTGYYAESDGYQHVIVATSDGAVHEVYFKGGGQGVGQDVLATFNGIVGVTGYYAESDGYQHVIVATSDGAVHEVYFKGGGQGVGQDVLATFNGIVGVTGYFATVDGYQHVIVATNDGAVHEVYFKGGGQGVGQDVLG